MIESRQKKIPIKFSAAFFITAGLIGFINSYSAIGTIVWIGIILVSVLVHEYGHALTSLMFGQRPRIEFVAFGGVTIPEGKKISAGKEFLVVLMGPVFGLLLFFASLFLVRFQILSPFFQSVFTVLAIVNLFWTAINLLPILPLDGGQLVRIILEVFIRTKAFKATLYLSIILGGLAAIGFFVTGFIFVGAIFLLLTFQNVETLRRFHFYSEADGQEENRTELKQIEELLKLGRVDEAASRLEKLLQNTKEGLIHTIASEYLARILFDHKEYKPVYEILSPIQKRISKEAKCLLFMSAYETKNYQKVIDLSGDCFSEKQTAEVALRAAASHAHEHDTKSAIEWLKTAKDFGGVNIEQVIRDEVYDSIRDDEAFKKLTGTDDHS